MNDFSADQKRYLEGFVSGVQAARSAQGLVPIGGGVAASGPAQHEGPDAIHLKAQDATTAAGKKLADQEKWKREEHPFDAYARLKEQSAADQFPKPADNFRWRYHGLFYVAPAQDSYMCRLRIPNGILKAWQFDGVADLAERLGGGYTHVTTRANLQIREIAARNAVELVEGLQDLGLTAKGSGADNIRNVTGDATAGIDPQALLDTRPYAREWHHHILNERALYGLPRKFNVAFDGGGLVPTLEDTNDIGFQAVEVTEGAGVEPGIWFRLALGGITGHKDLARDTGIVVRPGEATKVADAIVRVFSREGDRTNRTKARLKYVLDAWGFEKFLAEVEAELGAPLARVDGTHVLPRPRQDRQAHIGVHKQVQPGMNWIGVVLPVGKLTVEQMRGLAALARDLGDGDLRLTVWQNLLISGVPTGKIEDAKGRIIALGLDWQATSIRAGLVACTGSTGCRFAGADTKGHAVDIARWCEERVTLDSPVNIHLTGCHHSCAQHYIGDIGLIGAKVPVNEEGDTVEGYHLVVGGGFGPDAGIGRELSRDIRAEDVPAAVERLLKTYLSHRVGPDETFQAFTRRHDIEALQVLSGELAE
jgi:ferredoxin-nitrite reductase